ncbi:MAG: hypothetical protein K5829_00535 [Treponema sp.]|nr:hypothetical protein [Treponema sp.]
MKMVKKVLLGLAMAATVLSLTACLMDDSGVNLSTYYKDKQGKIAYYAQIAAGTTMTGSWYVPNTTFYAGDDTEGAISGSGQKYTLEYTNTDESAYRSYKETAMKHVGALIKVTFDSADVGKSKMGVIFDLKEDDENEDAKQFYIIGLNPRSDVANFYVSKFTNVTDIQASNFGTDLDDNPAVEKEIVALNTTNNITIPDAADDGTISFYIYYKLNTNGEFEYAVLDMEDDDMSNFKSNKKFLAADISEYTVLKKGTMGFAEYEAAETDEEE